MITTPVPTVALLAAARAMTQPEPPADLGLERAVRESQLPPMPTVGESILVDALAGDSEPPLFSEPLFSEPPSSERLRRGDGAGRRAKRSRDGQLLPSEPFEFELSSRPRGSSPTNSQAAPPLAEELGLDHLLTDFKPRRSGAAWLRTYGVWIVAAGLVLWLIVTFAARWLPGSLG